MLNYWKNLIFDEQMSSSAKASQVFDYQYEYNPVYRRFCDHFKISSISAEHNIPLLPIQAFREIDIISSEISDPDLKFQSSGTTGMKPSRHLVAHESIYRKSIRDGMNLQYDLSDYAILGYTPGYADNPNSSLIWMINSLIEADQSGFSQFLPLDKLISNKLLDDINQAEKKVLLFGAAFGLLDIIEENPVTLPADSIILETGGMKTHRREISREDLHQQISDGFGVFKTQVHSEYGMAEMLSQAYCKDGEWFEPVPWLQIIIRDPENPIEEVADGTPGLVGIIDLANIYSCSFFLTQDVGIRRSDGKFKILGRHHEANLRGCNFLVEEE